MTKYIDADLLRKEIEKKSHEEQGFSSGDSEYGYHSCARDLLAFINSLQQEQVVMSDTDKSNLRDVPAIIRASNHPFKENLALTLEKYIK